MNKFSSERFLAKTGELLTRTGVAEPRVIGRFILGTGTPLLVPILYFRTNTPASELTGWAEFKHEGPSREPANFRGRVAQIVEKRTPFPAFYTRGAEIVVENGVMDELASDHPDGEEGIAWQFGDVTMFGPLPAGQRIEGSYGMRVPEGGSLATSPARRIAGNQIVLPEGGVHAVDQGTVALESLIHRDQNPAFRIY
jgi:hypothetical protein